MSGEPIEYRIKHIRYHDEDLGLEVRGTLCHIPPRRWGLAICAPGDHFDKRLGRLIAHTRAERIEDGELNGIAMPVSVLVTPRRTRHDGRIDQRLLIALVNRAREIILRFPHEMLIVRGETCRCRRVVTEIVHQFTNGKQPPRMRGAEWPPASVIKVDRNGLPFCDYAQAVRVVPDTRSRWAALLYVMARDMMPVADVEALLREVDEPDTTITPLLNWALEVAERFERGTR